MTMLKVVDKDTGMISHPLRAEVEAVLTSMLTPSATGVLMIVAHRDAPVEVRAIPDIDPLVDGLLVAACESRGCNID